MGSWLARCADVRPVPPFWQVPLKNSSMFNRAAGLDIWTLGIGAFLAMSRFLLPLLPLPRQALRGVAFSHTITLAYFRALSLLSVSAFIAAVSARCFVFALSVVPCLQDAPQPKDYLLANSPITQRSEFVNREIDRFGRPGRALIFCFAILLRRVPLFNGDPEHLLNESAAAEFFGRLDYFASAESSNPLGAQVAGLSPRVCQFFHASKTKPLAALVPSAN